MCRAAALPPAALLDQRIVGAWLRQPGLAPLRRLSTGLVGAEISWSEAARRQSGRTRVQPPRGRRPRLEGTCRSAKSGPEQGPAPATALNRSRSGSGGSAKAAAPSSEGLSGP